MENPVHHPAQANAHTPRAYTPTQAVMYVHLKMLYRIEAIRQVCKYKIDIATAYTHAPCMHSAHAAASYC